MTERKDEDKGGCSSLSVILIKFIASRLLRRLKAFAPWNANERRPFRKNGELALNKLEQEKANLQIWIFGFTFAPTLASANDKNVYEIQLITFSPRRCIATRKRLTFWKLTWGRTRKVNNYSWVRSISSFSFAIQSTKNERREENDSLCLWSLDVTSLWKGSSLTRFYYNKNSYLFSSGFPSFYKHISRWGVLNTLHPSSVSFKLQTRKNDRVFPWIHLSLKASI